MFVTTKKPKNIIKLQEKPCNPKHYVEKLNLKPPVVTDDTKLYTQKTEKKLKNTRKSYIYVRVLSKKQDVDLQQQIKYLSKKYPKHEVVSDIESGINRKGFEFLLDKILSNTVKEIVVAHRDRLPRFSLKFIAQTCKKFGTKIKVLGGKSKSKIPPEELAEDLISIITVFTAR